MKIVATIKGYEQVSSEGFEERRTSYIFDSSDSIDKMLEKTGTKHLDRLNLSEVKED